tara:strand:+ start:158 stop:745 length:588 start_codon:yes stop_codon:yes gene_type:complete
MEKERKAYAPFSLTSEAGVAQTPVEGYIDVVQKIFPSVTTGTINENGTWTGVKSDDAEFIGLTKAVQVANGGEVLFPDTNDHPNIDMTGFTNLFIAYRPTRGGNIAQEAIMGPDTLPFANLSPINAAAALRGLTDPTISSFGQALLESSEALTADVWNIFYIGLGRLANQKNMQFKVVNNSGGASTIEFGFMRLV